MGQVIIRWCRSDKGAMRWRNHMNLVRQQEQWGTIFNIRRFDIKMIEYMK